MHFFICTSVFTYNVWISYFTHKVCFKEHQIKFVIFTFSFLIMHTSRALKLILSQSAHTVHTNVIGVLVNPIRRDNYIIFQYSNKQEGYGPCCSPKKHFQVINKPEQKQVT